MVVKPSKMVIKDADFTQKIHEDKKIRMSWIKLFYLLSFKISAFQGIPGEFQDVIAPPGIDLGAYEKWINIWDLYHRFSNWCKPDFASIFRMSKRVTGDVEKKLDKHRAISQMAMSSCRKWGRTNQKLKILKISGDFFRNLLNIPLPFYICLLFGRDAVKSPPVETLWLRSLFQTLEIPKFSTTAWSLYLKRELGNKLGNSPWLLTVLEIYTTSCEFCLKSSWMLFSRFFGRQKTAQVTQVIAGLAERRSSVWSSQSFARPLPGSPVQKLAEHPKMTTEIVISTGSLGNEEYVWNSQYIIRGYIA